MRRERDHYPTPPELVRACIGWTPELDVAATVLDASCGDGAFRDAVRQRWVDIDHQWCPRAFGLDIEPGPAVDIAADYLVPNEAIDGRRWKAIVGNPPYGLAGPWIRRSLALAPVVGLLLRLAILESRARVDLWPTLARVHVLAERPSFTGNGRTDSAAYAWLVWRRDHRGPAALTVHSWRS